jgi:polysaccharide export outer membrane protein
MAQAMHRNRFSLSAILAGLSLLAACSLSASAQFQGPAQSKPVPEQVTGPQAGPNITPSAIAALPTSAPIILVAGDTLDISVVGILSLTSLHPQVNSNGDIQVPYLGPVHVGGLTIGQTAELLSAKWREGDYIRNAQVSIQITSAPSDTIAVTGEVKSPTVVTAVGQRRLMDVIAAAGGLTSTASHLVTITRRGSNVPIQVLLDSNPANSEATNVPVYPGDTVLVPKAGIVYVLGSVKTPNAFPIATNTPFTLTQAIAMAGGANFEASLSTTRIIRTEGDSRRAIALDLKKIFNGKQPDPILQADDIVYVPGSAFKGAVKNGGVSLLATGILGITYYIH